MDRLVYTLLSSMQRSQESQGVTAHNLANVSTPGFRREMLALQQAWLDPGGPALVTRVQAGGESPHDLLRAGRLEQTGRPLDIALEGGSWLAVADGTGAPALTRRGDLRVDPEGVLRIGSGEPVLGADGPVRLAGTPAAVRIAPDGRVETRATPEEPFVEVARLRLVSPAPQQLRRGADGLFRAEAALEPDPLARLVPGALERSNVETSEALVELVEQSRSFEVQARLLATTREMDERTAGLMRMEG